MKIAETIKGWWHCVEHWLGWNDVDVEMWHEGDDAMIGFKCRTCGEMEDVEQIPERVVDFPIDVWSEKIANFLTGGYDYGDDLFYLTGDPGEAEPGAVTRKEITYCGCEDPNIFMVEDYCRDCEAMVREITVLDLSNYDWPHKEWTPFRARVLIEQEGPGFWVRSITTGNEYEVYEHQMDEI